MLSITVRFDFAAAHQLTNPDWDDAQNEAAFGHCARKHGHNYDLEITVSGEVDASTGMIANFSDIKQLVNEVIINEVDHQDLDADVAWLSEVMTTAENLVEAFWQRLEPAITSAIPSARLDQIRLWENKTSCATRDSR